MHGGLSAVDVVRKLEAGEQLNRALRKVISDGGAESLLSLVLDRTEECTTAARSAAFDALMATGSAESVAALFEVASHAAEQKVAAGFDLYRAARQLSMAALLRHCGSSSEEQLDALQEADLATVGDLVRYCSDGASDSDEDLEQHVSALALETLGLVERATLRQLVGEARALCHATARLHGRGQGDGVPQLGDMAPEPPRHHLWSTGAESDETAQATVLRRLEEEAAEEYDDLREIDHDEARHDEEVEGPLPGTRSVGC